MPKILTLSLFGCLLFLSCDLLNNKPSQVLTAKEGPENKMVYKYLSFEPGNYNPESVHALMIFLHGAGERGEDLEMLKVHGPPMQIVNGKKFDCFVLAPLCPKEVWWDVERLEETLKAYMNLHKIDKSKIYLTGLSMGGYATWKWSCKYPEHFAAIAPICGGGDPENVSGIKDMPTWAFHGAKDYVVDISESQKMIDALKKIGADPKFTIYPEADHNSWTETYDNPEFYNWFFSHTKSQKK